MGWRITIAPKGCDSSSPWTRPTASIVRRRTRRSSRSAYPYLGGFADPESLPLGYYARLRAESALPVLVVEGGWPSISVGAITSSPAEQARYFKYHARLLDSTRAVALLQLTFTDLDLSAIPLPPGSILPLFAHLGLVDSALGPKPALAVWDSVFAAPLSP